MPENDCGAEDRPSDDGKSRTDASSAACANANHPIEDASVVHPRYKPQKGPFSWATIDCLTLRDESRGKDLQLRVSFPAEDGVFPVVLFSHGASGSKDAYRPLIKHWVSHGYICIQPTHSDSLMLLPREERRKYASLIAYISSPYVREQWLSRAEDIRFVIDRLADVAAESGLRDRLDASRIGMGGHSFGSQTSQLIAGMSLQLPDRTGRFAIADPRPIAFVMLSPQGMGGTIDEQSWVGMSRPVMMATGSHDNSSKGLPYTWRLEAFARVPAHDKYLLLIEGGHHDFGGISGARYSWAGPHNHAHVDWVNAATVAFWDAHLKDDAGAFDFLRSGRMLRASHGAAEIRSPRRNDPMRPESTA
jgi:predicted dienelactone hydrolase